MTSVEVRGQLCRNRELSGHLCAFDRLRHPPVQLDPSRHRQALIEHIPIQRMHERITRVDGAVWHFNDVDMFQPELAMNELVALGAYRARVTAERVGHYAYAKLDATNCGSLQERLHVGIETHDLLFDYTGKTVG